MLCSLVLILFYSQVACTALGSSAKSLCWRATLRSKKLLDIPCGGKDACSQDRAALYEKDLSKVVCTQVVGPTTRITEDATDATLQSITTTPLTAHWLSIPQDSVTSVDSGIASVWEVRCMVPVACVCQTAGDAALCCRAPAVVGHQRLA